MLLVEYAAVTIWVPAHAVLTARGGGWARLSGVIGLGHLWVLAATIALALLPVHGVPPRQLASSAQVRMLGCHVALYAAFVGLSVRVLGRVEPPPGPMAAWATVWLACGMASVVTVCLPLLGVPSVRLRELLRAALVGGGLALVTRQLGTWSQDLWHPLARWTLGAVAAVLSPFVPNLFMRPEEALIGVGDYVVHIGTGCSGYEGVGLIVVLMTAYLATFRQTLRFPHAFWLVPLGAVLVLSGNVVRLSLLILIGAFVDPELADNGFHSKAGWVLFCAIALTLASIGHRSRYFAHVDTPDDRQTENPTAGYLLPLLAQIAASLLVGALARAPAVAYGARVLAGTMTLVACRRSLGVLRDAPSPGAALVGIGVAVVWIGAAPGGFGALTAGAPARLPAWVVAVHLLGSIAVAPLTEELALRGFLLRRLVAKNFDEVPFDRFSAMAVTVSSVAFGLLHERWLVASIAGFAYAYAQLRRGRLLDAVMAHAVTNAAIAAWVLTTGDLSHWF